jgi:hypothetical protein
MNSSYLIKHWFSALLIAPILSDIINYYYTDIQTLFNLTSVYPITLIFGLFFSLPTYIILGITYYILEKKGVKPLYIKPILLILCSIGIIITFYIVFNKREENTVLAYLLTSIFFGMIYKIENNDTNKNQHYNQSPY